MAARIPARRANKRLLVAPHARGRRGHDHRLELPGLPAGTQVVGRAGGGLHRRRPAQRADAHERHGAGQPPGEAGIPPGVFNLVNGQPGPMGEVFLRSPHVDKLSFTGSQAVGRLLMRGAADGIKRLSLELGGSAPVLVLPDADPEQAAEALRGRQVPQQRAGVHLAQPVLCASRHCRGIHRSQPGGHRPARARRRAGAGGDDRPAHQRRRPGTGARASWSTPWTRAPTS